MSRLVLLIAVVAIPVFCQVQVDVRTNQATYLVGEPIFVVVDVKNMGPEPVGYSDCDGRAYLTVPGGQKKQTPNLYGCVTGSFSGGGGCGIDHPPLMKLGETVSFWYLVRGYNLRAGDYILHASGKAGVRWRYHGDYQPIPAPPVVAERSGPVDGQMFDVSLKLIIMDATEAELRQRYASYVADAADGDLERRPRAREAIAEMAPPFLEKTLLGFANGPWTTAILAVEGLGQIPTSESRSDLISLFDKSADLGLRAFIVQKLAGIGTTQEVAFFSSLLAGRSTSLDDKIRQFAVLGLGRIGGKEAVMALESALRNLSPEVRAWAAMALGNTKDPGAVPVLIRMYADESGRVESGVCSALMTLTHYKWCPGDGNAKEVQARWRRWWRSHASRLPLYDTDHCPAPGDALPEVK